MSENPNEIQINHEGIIDPANHRFRKRRMAHWDRVASQKESARQPGAYYHKLIHHYYRFLLPKKSRILELGCGHGELLAALKPSVGVGCDFSEEMICRASQKHPELFFIRADAHDLPIKEQFDFIILSDLINDIWDVQTVLEKLRPLTHPCTRLVLNFYNNIWRIPLGAVKRLGLGADLLDQSWFAPSDVFNLLQLAGYEVINHRSFILLPINLSFVARLANRYLVNFPPFRWLALTNFAIARPIFDRDKSKPSKAPSVSVIIPTRNEAGNIKSILQRMPVLGKKTELIFVEGHSSDNTYETINELVEDNSDKKCKVFQQSGRGKGDAVRLGFEMATGEMLIILDADLTVPPEDLPRFVDALASGRGEFINGVRLVYPLEDQSMRFLNMVGNKFFSLVFSWLLGQPVKDTLCGTKVLWRRNYKTIAANREYFGDFDPFGDFDLLFGAAKLNFKLVEMPIRYRSRKYGSTNIDRWRHGWVLLRMVVFAARRLKFI